jgi:hypothetical protein
MKSSQQNIDLTFKANRGVGRHGWLRLTPAYGVRVVRDKLASVEEGQIVTDPFSGSGTTALAAAEDGHIGQGSDINPFLVWLGNTKCAEYSEDDLEETLAAVSAIESTARKLARRKALWTPNIANIERWWNSGVINMLSALKLAIDEESCSEKASNLLRVGFSRVVMEVSNASFNHQSMSFKSDVADESPKAEAYSLVLSAFRASVVEVVSSAREPLAGTGSISLVDARHASKVLRPCDLLITSPPYVNRMSYIRELRPYMYWLSYLVTPKDAGSLDWEAIGGTWGTATSNLNHWEQSKALVIDKTMTQVTRQVENDGGKNGFVLAQYIRKYFEDMAIHFEAAMTLVKPGGSLSYIVGNSTFYGHVVPAEEWYAKLMKECGFENVQVSTIRKRNSKKELFEFDVTARRPK